MKTAISIMIFILFNFTIFGQIDSIKNSILNYQSSKTNLIAKGRIILLDQFLGDDFEKVREIKNYLLKNVEDENYIALLPNEHWLILYWTKEYEELLKSTKSFDSIKALSYETRIKPTDDLLLEKLRSKSIKNSKSLVDQIYSSDLDEESQQFLLLHLDALIYDKNQKEKHQDSLNLEANRFIERFPVSQFESYTKNYIRFELVPGNWGVAFELYMGLIFFTQTLEENFTNQLPLGFGMDLYYKKLELYYRNSIGFSDTKKEFDLGFGPWIKGSEKAIYLYELSIGYNILDRKKFKITPFMGIGSISIKPTEYYLQYVPRLDEMDIGYTPTYLLGGNLDLKFNRKNKLKFKPNVNYWFLRFRYTYYMPQFENKFITLSGNMHEVTIGLAYFAGGLKRKL